MAAVMVFTLLPTSAYAQGERPDYSNWTEISDLSQITDSGSYYLNADVDLTSGWTVPSGKTVNLSLNGHVIRLLENQSGWKYSVITVPANTTLNLYDDDDTEHYGHIDSEKHIWVPDTVKQATGNVSIYGGYITGGTGTQESYSGYGYINGGGVYVNGSAWNQLATFNMYGGNIVGNSLDSAATNITLYGGGVYVNYGSFKMMGGTIQGNFISNPRKSATGGGVYVAGTYGSMIAGGNAVVLNNYGQNSHTSNVYIGNGNVHIENPSQGMSVGVNVEKSYVYPGDESVGIIGTEADIAYLSSDDTGLTFVYREEEYGNYIKLHRGGFNLCNGLGFMGDYPGDDVFGISVYDSATGEYAIDTDYEFAGWYTERTGGTKICDGKPEPIVAGTDYYAHWTYKGAPVLTERILVYGEGIQVGGKCVYNADIESEYGEYGLSYNETDGVVADGIVITSAKEYAYPDYGNPAGVTICEADAKYTMNSGSIRGIFDNYSGDIQGYPGIYVDEGTFTMNGGSIEKNMAPRSFPGTGGGVFVDNTASFIMNAGYISDNIVIGCGGGAYVAAGGSFIMNGGTISGNVAITDEGSFGVGGGVCVEKGATFNAFGGTITNNFAEFAGGGVYVAAGTADDGNDPNLAMTCLAEGTPITLADGTRTAIENLKAGDVVRVFDHETGTLSTAKLYVIEKLPAEANTAFTLHFTNDIDVTVVNSHCFFEETANCYVSIKRENANEYIGHRFYNADAQRWETLRGVTLLGEIVNPYMIETEKTLNAVANGMLSNGDSIFRVLINIFDYAENLKIDAAQKEADIAQYGLWGFEEAKAATRETYDAYNLQYFNVAVGKGMLKPEQIIEAGEYHTTHNPDIARPEALHKVQPKEQPQAESKTLPKSPFKALQQGVVAKNMPVNTAGSAPLDSSIVLGGTVRIVGNFYYETSSDYADNICFCEGSPLIAIGTGDNAPKTGMSVGVSTFADLESAPFAFTTACDFGCEKYFFSDWSDSYVNFNTDHLELKMPASGCYLINIASASNGTVTVPSKEVAGGSPVTVTVLPDNGYILKSLKYNGTDITDGSFDMPAENVTITAEFEEHPHNIVKVDGQAATESVAGFKDYYECKESEDACGALYEDTDGTVRITDLATWKAVGGNGYIAPLVHTITGVNGLNPTASNAGYKAYYECRNCGKYYEDAAGSIQITDLAAWKAEGGNGYLAKVPGVYAITVTTDGNGTAAASKDTAEVGTMITLSVTPNTGFCFKEWEVLSGEVIISENNTFELPACDVKIKAVFNEMGGNELVVAGEVASSAVIDVIENVIEMSQTEVQAISAGNDFETILEINETSTGDETVGKVNEVLSGEDVTDTYYIDISLLLKNVTTNENRPVTETKQCITITVKVPDEIADKTSSIGIVRYHEGVAEIIPSTYDPVTRCITFETDKFSVYVIYGTSETKPYTDYLDPLREFLGNYIILNMTGDTVVWDVGDALPYDVMELIKKSDITVEFKCTYEGKDYDIFINRDNAPEEYVPWYGVLYLAGLPAIGSKDAGIHGEYVIVKDDTLNVIAAKLNTTVDELLRLNPDITNRNLIYPGQILKY